MNLDENEAEKIMLQIAKIKGESTVEESVKPVEQKREASFEKAHEEFVAEESRKFSSAIEQLRSELQGKVATVKPKEVEGKEISTEKTVCCYNCFRIVGKSAGITEEGQFYCSTVCLKATIEAKNANYVTKTECHLCGTEFDKEKQGVLADVWLCSDICYKAYFEEEVAQIEEETEQEEDIDVLEDL